MKVIFLDFDGCLNSYQEVYVKKYRRERSWYWDLRERLANLLCRGPLADFARYRISDHAEFCNVACSNIQHLLAENSDIRIVVSSVWRTSGVKRLRQIFRRNNIDESRIIGITPGRGVNAEGRDMGDEWMPNGPRVERGNQIQAWLTEWQGEAVTHFAIIDDDSDMAHLTHRFVHVDGRNGFMWTDMEKVAGLLEAKR